MPNPSELERQAVEQMTKPEPALRRLKWWWQKSERWPERIAIWIAWRLPKKVALWAMIRVAAHATTGKWGHIHPGLLTYGDMHDRWSEDND